MQTWSSLWKSMAQDGSADAVGDDNWVARMVDQVQWKHLKRGPRPLGFVSFDDKEISDAELDTAEKRINRKLADDDLDHQALALTPPQSGSLTDSIH